MVIDWWQETFVKPVRFGLLIVQVVLQLKDVKVAIQATQLVQIILLVIMLFVQLLIVFHVLLPTQSAMAVLQATTCSPDSAKAYAETESSQALNSAMITTTLMATDATPTARPATTTDVLPLLPTSALQLEPAPQRVQLASSPMRVPFRA